MSDNDRKWVEEALGEAEKAIGNREAPVGSVVIRDGEEVSRAHPRVRRDSSTASHAEILALRGAGDALEAEGEVILYTTEEPCVMCAAAALRCGVDRVVYALEAENEDRSMLNLEHEKMSIEGGILQNRAVELFERFLRKYPDHVASNYVEELLGPYQ